MRIAHVVSALVTGGAQMMLAKLLEAGSDPADDLLIVDGVVFRGPSSQSELLRRAMGELRSAGTACESYAIDNNVYPGPIEPTGVVATR